VVGADPCCASTWRCEVAASSQCVTTTATDAGGVKTITTTCSEHPDWVWAHWGWIVLVTVVVLSVGYAVCQWYDRRDARKRSAAVLAAHQAAEAAYREIRDRDYSQAVRKMASRDPFLADPKADPS
jgi:hypothetical protein